MGVYVIRTGVKSMYKPTLNQIIILLDIRRGSYVPSRHMGNVEKEVKELIRANLVKEGEHDQGYELTVFGKTLTDHIMEESKYEIRLMPGRQML
jgi:hypothetical protein